MNTSFANLLINVSRLLVNPGYYVNLLPIKSLIHWTSSTLKVSILPKMSHISQEGGDIGIRIADSLRCTAETNTTL